MDNEALTILVERIDERSKKIETKLDTLITTYNKDEIARAKEVTKIKMLSAGWGVLGTFLVGLSGWVRGLK